MSSGRSPDQDQLARRARGVLDRHWRPPGFTCPNAGTYPWLWLWDSCFHAVVWAELGDATRARSELSVALSAQTADGFVPHLQYLDGFEGHAGFWGRRATSSITQPPVYGHAIAELARRGVEVEPDTLAAATGGLRFLLERRRRSPAGLVEIVHPWESGCDHSPRWDDLIVPVAERATNRVQDPYDGSTWFRRKGELLAGIERSASGSPVANAAFPVGSVAFSALVAHSATALARVTGDAALSDQAAELADAVVRRWDPGSRTFVDDGPTATGSGRVRTSEALLGVLVVDDPAIRVHVLDELVDPGAFGGAFGPAQVRRDEPTYRRGAYWRGPSWPQLDHLLELGLPAGAGAAGFAASWRAGAVGSGWAEYWDPDDADAGGAAPQSWTTLAICPPRFAEI